MVLHVICMIDGVPKSLARFVTGVCGFPGDQNTHTHICVVSTEKSQVSRQKAQVSSQKSQVSTEKSQVSTEKSQFSTEKSRVH
jgi:hypothetical protein